MLLLILLPAQVSILLSQVEIRIQFSILVMRRLMVEDKTPLQLPLTTPPSVVVSQAQSQIVIMPPSLVVL